MPAGGGRARRGVRPRPGVGAGRTTLAAADALDARGRGRACPDRGARPTGRFRFVHALMQRYLYGELGAARRDRAAPAGRAGDGGRAGTAAVPGRRVGAASGSARATRSCQTRSRTRSWPATRRWRSSLPTRPGAGMRCRSSCSPASASRRSRKCDLLIKRGEAERQAGDRGFRETLLEAAEHRAADRRRRDGWSAPRWPTPAACRARPASSTRRGSRRWTRRCGSSATATALSRARLLAMQAAELMYSRANGSAACGSATRRSRSHGGSMTRRRSAPCSTCGSSRCWRRRRSRSGRRTRVEAVAAAERLGDPLDPVLRLPLARLCVHRGRRHRSPRARGRRASGRSPTGSASPRRCGWRAPTRPTWRSSPGELDAPSARGGRAGDRPPERARRARLLRGPADLDRVRAGRAGRADPDAGAGGAATTPACRVPRHARARADARTGAGGGAQAMLDQAVASGFADTARTTSPGWRSPASTRTSARGLEIWRRPGRCTAARAVGRADRVSGVRRVGAGGAVSRFARAGDRRARGGRAPPRSRPRGLASGPGRRLWEARAERAGSRELRASRAVTGPVQTPTGADQGRDPGRRLRRARRRLGADRHPGAARALRRDRVPARLAARAARGRAGGSPHPGGGRSGGQRIEEHGLHIWFGFYQHAFRMLRGRPTRRRGSPPARTGGRCRLRSATRCRCTSSATTAPGHGRRSGCRRAGARTGAADRAGRRAAGPGARADDAAAGQRPAVRAGAGGPARRRAVGDAGEPSWRATASTLRGDRRRDRPDGIAADP